MSLIAFDNVSYHFNSDVAALKEITCQVDNQEFIFLVGPSGSGKTTFLRLLIRDLIPSQGLINFDGIDITQKKGISVPHLRRKIGVCFQDMKLLNDRTIEENIAVTLEILGKDQHIIADSVNAALELVGLKNKAKLFPAQLSGGEVQRVGLARAVVGNPMVVFADEPTANLDEESSWRIMSLLREINRSGKTVIVSTHNTDVVNSMKERTIKLNYGKLVDDTKKPPAKIKINTKKTSKK